jgi:hypothetical protein
MPGRCLKNGVCSRTGTAARHCGESCVYLVHAQPKRQAYRLT